MASATPVWTDNITLLGRTTLARGITANTSTFDLRGKWGANVFIRIGRGGTAALSSGVVVNIRRTINGGAILQVGGSLPSLVSQTAAAVSQVCAAAGNNAGVTTLTLNAAQTYAAGDIVFIDGSAGSGNSEWCRVAVPLAAGTALILDAPTKFAHNNILDAVRNKADVFPPIWVEGGAVVELSFDHGADTTGDAVTIEAFAQTMDSVLIS
jgi:hypothetical protein